MILDFVLQKLIENHPPELNAEKCINSLRKNNSCNICKESCPENAIYLKENKVFFDESSCNECGLCKVKCPTQAIKVKNIREKEIFADAGERKNLVFACSIENGTGNLRTSCLNALHPEFISALFILHREKKLHFNLSKCLNCNNGYEDTMFKDSLNKAVKFVNTLGIDPVYEIYTDENELSNLVVEEISRRDLFKLVKKESGDMAVKTVNSIINNEDDEFSSRNILLYSLKNLKYNNEKEKDNSNIFWEYWDVNIDCDGCGKCKSVCAGKAWNIEKGDTDIKLYHKSSNCYKCGLCEQVCPKKAISKGNIDNLILSEYNLKREINLKTCKTCNKKFIPSCNEDECEVCKKKELLRRKISTSLTN